jgi:hypothetical protein
MAAGSPPLRNAARQLRSSEKRASARSASERGHRVGLEEGEGVASLGVAGAGAGRRLSSLAGVGRRLSTPVARFTALVGDGTEDEKVAARVFDQGPACSAR